jgi:hypothetical protein
MRRSRRLGSALAAASTFVIAAVARAGAPIDQYDLFSMNTPTIHDVRTGLTWQRNVSTQTMTFDAAAAYCTTMSMPQAGLPDSWRVPSYKELLTLVDEQPQTEYDSTKLDLVKKWIDVNAFPMTPVLETYWTSSLFPGAASAYAVDFGSGTPFAQPLGTGQYVRCVHD